MKITLKLLEEKGACKEAMEEFEELNLEGIEVYDLIKMLEERKDSEGYTWWLFRELKLTGSCKGYYRNGSLKYDENYKNDEKHGSCKSYYSDGSLMYDENYKNGEKHGNCKGYYSDGSLEYDYNYKNGERHGNCKGYYSDGSLMYAENYENGERHGNCKEYYSDGSLMYDYNFKNGERQNKIIFTICKYFKKIFNITR